MVILGLMLLGLGLLTLLADTDVERKYTIPAGLIFVMFGLAMIIFNFVEFWELTN